MPKNSKRSLAAKKGWQTRRTNASRESRKRHRAALKGWETRRSSARSAAARKGWATRRERLPFLKKSQPVHYLVHFSYQARAKAKKGVPIDIQIELTGPREIDSTVAEIVRDFAQGKGLPKGWNATAIEWNRKGLLEIEESSKGGRQKISFDSDPVYKYLAKMSFNAGQSSVIRTDENRDSQKGNQ